jgi:hypothetical protein
MSQDQQSGQGQQGQQSGQQGQAQLGQQSGQGNQAGQQGQNGQQVTDPGQNQGQQGDPTGQGPTNSQNVNGGNPSGDASVPYSDVIDSYQQQAAQQLDKNYIPITLKDQVKQYFEDLNNKNK